jgi:hypothetical protein
MDMVDELIVLLAGIGVIKSEISFAPIGLCNLKVEANGLGVTDMKVTIGLGREPGIDLTFSEGTVCSKDLGRVANVDIPTDQF